MNGYTQRVSEIIISQNIINTHLIEDFFRHSLAHIDGQTVNDIRINDILENNANTSINDLIIDIGINRLIPEERKICGINLEEIQTVQKYMSCVECLNNFNEISIKIWLTQRRTCPSCRSNWSDFNVYI